ncbi:MAG: DUF547 domain-containing protein, partial [Oceanihabitans sp.]|nr:DUF547 domain-containing protein [Oceanihabitans sp.]
MKKIIVVALILLGGLSAKAQNLETFFTQADAFFKANVLNGKVAYDAIKKDTKSLDAVLKIAEGITVS